MTYDPEKEFDDHMRVDEPTPFDNAVLPDGISTDDEIETSWDRDEYSTRITATLGEASITVEASEDGAHLVPWLLGAMPSILNAVTDAIDNEDPQEGQ